MKVLPGNQLIIFPCYGLCDKWVYAFGSQNFSLVKTQSFSEWKILEKLKQNLRLDAKILLNSFTKRDQKHWVFFQLR